MENIQPDFGQLGLDELSDYIVENHHRYVRNAIPKIKENLQSLNQKSSNPIYEKISKTFDTMAQELEDHMAGEEKYLFPYIKKILKAKAENTKLPKPGFGSLPGPIANHIKDHAKASDTMAEIHQISNGYKLSGNEENKLKEVYKQLKEFEKDLEQHIHLENEIMFDKAIALEKEVVE